MSRVDAFGVRIGAYSACIMGCAGNLVGLSNTIESRGVTVDGVLDVASMHTEMDHGHS